VEMCQTCYDFDCRRFNVLVLGDFKLIDERGGTITCSFVRKYERESLAGLVVSNF